MEDENYISFLPESDHDAGDNIGMSGDGIASGASRPPAKRARRSATTPTPANPPTTKPYTHSHPNAPQPEAQAQAQARNRNPWLRPVHAYSRKPCERLHQEIRDLIAYLSPTPGEKKARQAAMDRVSAVVGRVCGGGGEGAAVLPFGSYFMDLYLPSSDIDLVVVHTDDTASSAGTTSEDQLRLLRKLARALGKANISAPNTLKVISKARVPIIKYVDKQSGYAVDVSVNVGSGLAGAKMMVAKMRRHDALRPITVFLKYYLTLRGLNEVFTGGLGSFSLMCMVLSFLDLHPLLQLGLIQEKDNVAVLLLDFLELYSKHFNYDQVGLRLHPISTYFQRRSRDDWDHLKRLQSPQPSSTAATGLSIEDPQSPENDLSRGSFQFSAVRQSLEHAFLVMTSRLAQADTRAMHIVEPLVWIPERTLRHRSFIDQQ